MSETKKPGATFILTVGPVHPVEPKDRPPMYDYRFKIIHPDGHHEEWQYDSDTDLLRVMRMFAYGITKWQGEQSQFGQHMKTHEDLRMRGIRAILEAK